MTSFADVCAVQMSVRKAMTSCACAAAKDLAMIDTAGRTPGHGGMTNLAGIAGGNMVRPLTTSVNIIMTIHTHIGIDHKYMVKLRNYP